MVLVSTLGRGYTSEAGHLSAALEAEDIINATGATAVHRPCAQHLNPGNVTATSVAQWVETAFKPALRS